MKVAKIISIGVLVGLAIVAALAALKASVRCIYRPGNHQGHFPRWIRKGLEIDRYQALTVEKQNSIELPYPSKTTPDSIAQNALLKSEGEDGFGQTV